MITSEVQRTLVKSPPELWTELSDPEALARHLGELGDIKITRTEPEKLVEWEAEGTTGTVAIKASGWGTKVTLTVNRELPPAAGAEEKAPREQAGDAEAAAVQASSPDGEPQADAGVRPEGAAGHDAAPGSGPRPAPVTEAARRAAGWPAADGPAIESDLRAAEAAEPGDLSLPAAWTGDTARAVKPSADREAGEDDATAKPEPRRGFLARLFGRRRRGAQAAAEPTPAKAALRLEAEAGARADTAAAGEAETSAEADLAGRAEDSAETQADRTPEHPATKADAQSGGEAGDASSQAARQDGPAGAAEAAEAAIPGPASAELLAPVEENPQAPAASGDESPAGQEGAEPSTAAEAPRADLAAELKAAEEIAAEEVKAVLTGVLDRLGAAHHRPFSRS